MATARLSKPSGLAAHSWWLRELAAANPQPELKGERRAGVCLVGGGFTGLWTALRLKQLEPALDVALVEADIGGSGASGRNGRLLLSFRQPVLELRHLSGPSDAL